MWLLTALVLPIQLTIQFAFQRRIPTITTLIVTFIAQLEIPPLGKIVSSEMTVQILVLKWAEMRVAFILVVVLGWIGFIGGSLFLIFQVVNYKMLRLPGTLRKSVLTIVNFTLGWMILCLGISVWIFTIGYILTSFVGYQRILCDSSLLRLCRFQGMNISNSFWSFQVYALCLAFMHRLSGGQQ